MNMQKEHVSLLFNYVCFSKFSFIPFIGIHTWKRGWRKREFRIDLSNDIQTTERDLVLSRRLAILILLFELCMRTIEIATCLSFGNLTIFSSFEYQNPTSFLFLYIPYFFLFPKKIKLPSKYQGALKFSFLFFKNTLQIVNPFILVGEFSDENVLSVKSDLVLHEKCRGGKDDVQKGRSWYSENSKFSVEEGAKIK